MTLKQCNKIATPHESNPILRTPKLTPNYLKLPKSNATVAKTTDNAHDDNNETEVERGEAKLYYVWQRQGISEEIIIWSDK